ncbi:MAG: ScyD/ScyE family protein [Gemmatimonadaceae bacterium]|nr:ScyD/ScyE family protein [Gemmatimonadaceae bacterium]
MTWKPTPLLAALVLSACARDAVTAPAAPPVSTDVSPAAATLSVVMSGLDSPRGLAWGPDGALYVAEAGSNIAGTTCVALARGANCYSGTGAITRLWRGRQQRVAAGLPSGFNAATNDIGGPQDISFGFFGIPYVTIGWGGAPDARAGLGALGRGFGSLLAVLPNGRWVIASDISQFEADNNPAGGPIDSNPYGLLMEAGRTFVTDAGGNSLLRVHPGGRLSLVSTFPSTPVPAGPFNPPFAQSEAVPTSVSRGPDGKLYVSTLTGVPFLPGAAVIYRVTEGQPPEVVLRGFTTILDFAVDGDRAVYVLQYSGAPFLNGPGSIVKVARDGTRTTITTALTHPTSILLGSRGTLYVSNNGDKAAIGEVLRIDQ